MTTLLVMSSCNVMPGSTKLENKFFDRDHYNNGIYLQYMSYTLNESAANDGSITDVIDIYLYGAEFNGTPATSVSGGDYSFSGVPSGLTLDVYMVDNNHIQIILNGAATSHIDGTDDTSFSIDFADALFSVPYGEIDNNGTAWISVDFI